MTNQPARRRSNSTRIVLGCLAVLACLCLAGAGAAAWFLVGPGSKPRNLAVEHTLPATVTQGDAFDLVLRLINTGSKPLTIDTIHVSQRTADVPLDSAVIVAVNPPLQRHNSVGGKIAGDYFTGLPPIAPGDTGVLTFTLQAGPPGDYQIKVAISVGPVQTLQFEAPITVLARP